MKRFLRTGSSNVNADSAEFIGKIMIKSMVTGKVSDFVLKEKNQVITIYENLQCPSGMKRFS